MSEWWNGLDSILKVLYCIAVPSSLILIIQTIISLCGIGDGGSGIEMSDTSGLDLSDLPDDMPDMSADVDTDISNMSLDSYISFAKKRLGNSHQLLSKIYSEC